MQPYPSPIAVRTQLRCKFSLPGRKYDCRRIGKYVLNGVGFCGPHYDTVWKREHPLNGQQHEWHFHVNHLNGNRDAYESCKRCGVVRPYEGLPQNPCGGVMPKVVLW